MKKTGRLLYAAVLIAAGIWITTATALAYNKTGNGDASRYNTSPIYLENSGTGIGAIGEAYVAGSDGLVQRTKFGRGVHVDAYSVKYDTYFAQNYSVASKYTRGDNIQNLYNLYMSTGAQGNISGTISWPSSIEYYVTEGEKLYVIDYTADYVYYWSPGFKSFSGNSLYNCDASVLLESHPAGFYKIKKDYVWLDLYSREETSAKKSASVGIAQGIYKTLSVFQKPGIENNSRCYVYKQNTELNIIDANPIKGENGETYYKAQIKGDTSVGYMECAYYNVYVNSAYINFYDKNVKVPKGYSHAIVKGVASGKVLKIFSKKDKSDEYRVPGYLSNGAKLKVYTEKSDSEWACIWHNNTYAYIPVKNIQYYVDEIVIQDVVDNKYIISWRSVPVEVNVSCMDNLRGNTIGKTVSCAANKKSLTLNNAVFKGHEGILKAQGIELTAEVPGSGIKAKKKLYYPEKPFTLLTGGKNNTSVSLRGFSVNAKNNGTVLEYSTNKNFKNAKKVYPTGNSYTVKGLKKNTTYYFRYYNSFKVKTENGKKLMKGQYSNVVKQKTTNITISKPTLKSLKGGKKYIDLKWTTSSKKASRTEIVLATDSKFTKNVVRGKVTKSLSKTRFSQLKANTKYYVKIRTCYIDYSNGGTEYYSGWTKVKTVKTK